MEGFAAERFDVKDGAFPATLVLERAAALRASLGGRDHAALVGFLRRDAAPSVARMPWPRSTSCAGTFTEGGIGFDGEFGRRRRRAKEAFPGGAFLITQASFEPSVFFLKAINRLLLFQALRAIAQVVETRRVKFWVWGRAPDGSDAGASVRFQRATLRACARCPILPGTAAPGRRERTCSGAGPFG